MSLSYPEYKKVVQDALSPSLYKVVATEELLDSLRDLELHIINQVIFCTMTEAKVVCVNNKPCLMETTVRYILLIDGTVNKTIVLKYKPVEEVSTEEPCL